MNSVKKVSDVVSEMSAATQEQASGIEQINHAVSQMDSVTQQNAALTEEATAASKAIEDQAEALMKRIAFFHTGEQSTHDGTTTNAHVESAAVSHSTSVDGYLHETAVQQRVA